MQVKDIMNPSVISVKPDDTAADAARLIARHNVGSLPVCGEDGGLRGIVTDRDIVLRCVAAQEDPSKTKVSALMSRNCATVSPQDDARAAAQMMAQSQVRRLPVLENDKVVGILSLGDLSTNHTCDMETAQALCRISNDPQELK